MTEEEKNVQAGASAAEQGSAPATPSEAEKATEASTQEKKTEPPVAYAFQWEHRNYNDHRQKEEKTVRVRAGAFYGLMIGAVFALLLAVLFLVLWIGESPAFGSGGVVSERVVYISGAGDAEEELAVEMTVAKVMPSSVSIIVSNAQGKGVGSGFVFSEDGYIATNYHVIEGKTSITVRFPGGKRYPATVAAMDEISDLALLKIDVSGLTPAVFANSDEILVGETVIAIGTPTGITYAETVTRGIVSCKARAVKIYNSNDTLTHKLLMVQTDAGVNPGNSGGPLVNRDGEVIGVISNKPVFYENSSSYYADDIGLAIPSNAAKAILTALKNGEAVDRSGFLIPAARLGVETVQVRMKDGYAADGISIQRFTNTALDASAKLRKNDIITAIDGIRVQNNALAAELLEDCFPGQTVTLTVARGGENMNIEVILGSDESA
ncbi:MAG: trypsin-like peptidase domain-containing protein [Clostridia bacterium]|nr:trypsin-like peptidase domain-containing protein [Clostridia bacterium]